MDDHSFTKSNTWPQSGPASRISQGNVRRFTSMRVGPDQIIAIGTQKSHHLAKLRCPSIHWTRPPRLAAGLSFLKRGKKRYGHPKVIVTDRLRSYQAVTNVIGNGADQKVGRWLNNRVENSHQPFRRREGAMSKFRDVKTLQKFGSIQVSIHNHFNLDRKLIRRDEFNQKRTATLAEWCQLAA